MRYFLFCIFSLLFVSLSAENLRIASYNLCNFLVCNRYVKGEYRKAYPKPEFEKQALYRNILAVSPDVLAIQEMGTRPFFEEFMKSLRAKGLAYDHYYLLEDVPDSERHIGVLTKKMPVYLKAHTNLSFKFFGERRTLSRGLLELALETESGRLYIFNLHLKSKYTVDKRDPLARKQRQGEAKVIRNYLQKRINKEPDAMFLVLGDFNDTINEASLRCFLFMGQKPLLRCLPLKDSRDEVWTFRYQKAGSYLGIDFILGNMHLFDMHSNSCGHIWDENPKDVATASDHRLIYADFRF